MVEETVTMEGHLIDSDILRKAFARIVEGGGDFEILTFKVGKTNDDPSFLRMSIKAEAPDVVDRILEDLSYLGATAEGPAGRGHGKKRAAKALVQNVRFAPSEADGSCPTSSTPRRTSTPSCAWTASGSRPWTRRWIARSCCARARPPASSRAR